MGSPEMCANHFGHLRTFAQTGGAQKNKSLSHRDLRKERAKPLHELRSFARERNPNGLFAVGDDDLAELELTLRQVMEAMAEKTRELTWHQAKVAPWWDLWREFSSQHEEMVRDEGFKVGGHQAAFRVSAIRRLDAQREELKPHFSEVSQLQGEVRNLKTKARGIQAEIKIVKSKRRRSA